MSDTNAGEQRRWNDERWTAVWPKRERLTGEVTQYLLAAAALRPGERVLDIGAGGGVSALPAARAVAPDGEVVGVDISTVLTRLAEKRATEQGVENAHFRLGDMQLATVAGTPFDVALSQFGVMFFDEPVVAFANIRRHLRPGGRLAFACWQPADRNPWFVGPAVADLLPPPAPLLPGKVPTGPFALGDPDVTAGILDAAGFTGIHRQAYELEVDAPSDSVVDDDQLTVMGIPDDRLPEARERVAAQLRRFEQAPGRSRFPLAFQVFAATA